MVFFDGHAENLQNLKKAYDGRQFRVDPIAR